MSSDKQIILYGTPWCSDCRRSRTFLDQNKVEYKYIDISGDDKASIEATKFVEKINGGYRSVPTIIFPDGRALTEPSNQELQEILEKNGFALG